MFSPILSNFNMFNSGYNPFGYVNQFGTGLYSPSIFSGINYLNPILPFFNFPAISYNNWLTALTQNVQKTNAPRLTYTGVKTAAKRVVKKAARKVSNGISVMNNPNMSYWQKLGYYANAGVRLSRYALSHAVGFTKQCATYVKNAIANCGLGKYIKGDAYKMIQILSQNKKFKRIDTKGVNLKTLPAGCVLVYDRNAGFSKKHGHVEISTGDGRCVSDGITRNPKKVPTAIFIPVSA